MGSSLVRWKNMVNWSMVLPPSRPTISQLEGLKQQLQFHKKVEPVAVLGSTPEFRDLLHEQGFNKIFVFDKSKKFYDSMSKMRIYSNRECFIKGDWLDTLKKYKKMFAVILSDLTIGNVPYNLRKAFYGLITDSLKRGGVFCDKVLVHDCPNLRVDDLTEKYSSIPLNLKYVNYFSCEMLFCSELIEIKEIVDSTYFYNLLEKKIKNKRVKAFLVNSQKITPPNFIWWYGKRWSEIKTDYCPDLYIQECKDDKKNSPYYKRLKFYKHIKK